MSMEWRGFVRRGGILGLAALIICTGSLVEGGGKPRDPLKQALYEDFPDPPESLDASPESVALLVLHTRITKGGGFRITGALLEREDDGTFVRASRFDKNLILFHDLPPGRYALRLIKFKQVMVGPYTMTVPREAAPVFELHAGQLRYVGVVRARVKTVFNSKMEIDYAPSSEVEAWNAFEQAYPGSAWSELVRQRLSQLQPTQPD